jgi:hypothetical protein
MRRPEKRRRRRPAGGLGVPLDDLTRLRDRVRSGRIDDMAAAAALPFIVERAIGAGADAAIVEAAHAGPPAPAVEEWTAFAEGMALHDFIAAAVARGAPPPRPVVLRGAEGVAMDRGPEGG